MIFIHGGYWQRNAREFFAIMAEGALQRGLAVAMPGYTLAPEATLTEIVDEIRLALDWLEGDSPLTARAVPRSSRAGPPAPIWRRWR